MATAVLRVLESCLAGSDQCCARFAAAHGRDVVAGVLLRHGRDKGAPLERTFTCACVRVRSAARVCCVSGVGVYWPLIIFFDGS